MKSRIVIVGIAVACAALAAPAAVGAQGNAPAKRVEPFTHLTAPRVDPGEPAPGSSAMTSLCPNRLDLCQKYWAYTVYFVDGYTIPFRDKEILILRTAWLSRGDYIWGRHYVRGKESGLTDEEIQRITEGPGAQGWSDFDATLLRAADELHTSRFVSDATWNALSARYTEDQVREVVLIVGTTPSWRCSRTASAHSCRQGTTGSPTNRRRTGDRRGRRTCTGAQGRIGAGAGHEERDPGTSRRWARCRRHRRIHQVGARRARPAGCPGRPQVGARFLRHVGARAGGCRPVRQPRSGARCVTAPDVLSTPGILLDARACGVLRDAD